MLWAVEAVEFEIPLSPLEVVLGKINRRRGQRSTSCGVNRKRTRVGE